MRKPGVNAAQVDDYDCFFLNSTPDWGQTGNESDNPSLDIDDFTGGGPENISLSEPENNTTALGGAYQVGVHYYSSVDRETLFDYGPSEARVRVYIRGELAWDFTDANVAGGSNPGVKEMSATGHFWNAAEITWPEGSKYKRPILVGDSKLNLLEIVIQTRIRYPPWRRTSRCLRLLENFESSVDMNLRIPFY